MALMMLHAALSPLKVNSLTSVVSWLRAALIDVSMLTDTERLSCATHRGINLVILPHR